MTLWLSNISIKDSPETRSIDALLMPGGDGARMDANHRLLWSLFTDGTRQERDFLWRQTGRRNFLMLSARKPAETGLLAVDAKPFEPRLRPGDTLNFSLRVNTARTAKTGLKNKRGYDAVHHICFISEAIAKAREAGEDDREAMEEVIDRWMMRKGEECGFRPVMTTCEKYSKVKVPGTHRRKGAPSFGIAELRGQLRVTEPETFLKAVAAGFGRGKAFGCGLMVLRRP